MFWRRDLGDYVSGALDNGKMSCMATTKKLLAALESIANDEDADDVLQSFDRIRTDLARDTTSGLPGSVGKQALRSIRDDARRLLRRAVRLARWGEGKTEMMRVAAMYMGQFDDEDVTGRAPDRALACRFVVRAEYRGRRTPALELVGPVDASPEFLVGYAFWLIAKNEPPSVWLRAMNQRCGNKECRRLFRNESTGRPRKYCPECSEKMHRMKDKRGRKHRTPGRQTAGKP